MQPQKTETQVEQKTDNRHRCVDVFRPNYKDEHVLPRYHYPMCVYA